MALETRTIIIVTTSKNAPKQNREDESKTGTGEGRRQSIQGGNDILQKMY